MRSYLLVRQAEPGVQGHHPGDGLADAWSRPYLRPPYGRDRGAALEFEAIELQLRFADGSAQAPLWVVFGLKS